MDTDDHDGKNANADGIERNNGSGDANGNHANVFAGRLPSTDPFDITLIEGVLSKMQC